MMKHKVLAGAVAVVALAAAAAGISGVVSGSTPVGDHYVDNLGTGTTASNFDGNSSSDCTTEAFTSGDYDLWHFVVTQASDPEAVLSWNAGLSVWSSPSSVNVVDVTTQYGNYTSGDGTKHLWIATTPVGATLVTAYLDYAGTAGRENLSHACGRSTPTPGIRIDPEMTERPVRWETGRLVRFMVTFGLVSTVADLVCLAGLGWWVDAPVEVVRTGWFVESCLTEVVVMLSLRTRRPIWRSTPSKGLGWASVVVAGVCIATPWIPIASALGFSSLHFGAVAWLGALTGAYVIATESLKRSQSALLPGGAVLPGA